MYVKSPEQTALAFYLRTTRKILFCESSGAVLGDVFVNQGTCIAVRGVVSCAAGSRNKIFL